MTKVGIEKIESTDVWVVWMWLVIGLCFMVLAKLLLLLFLYQKFIYNSSLTNWIIIPTISFAVKEEEIETEKQTQRI